MRRGRRGGGDPLFFEGFRAALGDAPAGLLRAGDPAAAGDLAAAEAALGRALPEAYAAFLRSFDGANLFDEAVVLLGVAGGAASRLAEVNRAERPALVRAGELIFAEGAAGDLFVLGAGGDGEVVFHLRGDGEERWLAGSSFARWLDALLARELLVYGDDGEFLLEAFEEDGEELTPRFALRQAERGLRKDPDSAEGHHDLGLAHRRLGHPDRARDAFARAAALDPENPWPSFDLGRIELALDRPADAIAPFRAAAAATPGPEGARFLAWTARAARAAGREDQATAARAEALARNPALIEELERAAEAAGTDEDPDAVAEATALVEAILPPRRRLPLV